MKEQLFKPLLQQWIPKAYMKRAVKFLLEHACGGLLLDPGMSKTAITLAAIKILIKKGLIKKVLVIAPVRVCYLVWPKEINKWMDFNGIRFQILHGSHKDEALQAEADIYLINPEGLQWLLQAKKIKRTTKTGKTVFDLEMDMKRWKSLAFDMLVIDELPKFKHPTSLRFKMLKLVYHLFGRRWGLTGSFTANGLMDVFGQCYILDQGRALGRYITHYRRTYFNLGYDGFTWKPKPGAMEKINERVAPMFLRMSAEDYLDMPELVENNIYVELPLTARKAYLEMEKDLLTAIDKKVVTASNAAVASGKCRQIASGGIYYGDGMMDVALGKAKREWAQLHTAKLDALEELLEELQGAPLLLGYEFQHDLERLQQRFGKDLPFIGGGTSMKKMLKIEEQWNNGEIKLLPAQPQAMAHGLNMQGMSQHVGWFSLTWNYELYDQLIRRVLRQGNQYGTVFVHHILAQDTIDDLVMLPSIQAKKHGQEQFFDLLKQLRSKRT